MCSVGRHSKPFNLPLSFDLNILKISYFKKLFLRSSETCLKVCSSVSNFNILHFKISFIVNLNDKFYDFLAFFARLIFPKLAFYYCAKYRLVMLGRVDGTNAVRIKEPQAELSFRV